MRRVPKILLRLKRSALAATFTLISSGTSGSVSFADTPNIESGFYLDYSPGRFVEYLSLNESSHQVAGYYETIHASTTAADGQSRTQIFAILQGSVLAFGKYTATHTADGFILTGLSRDGEIMQRHLRRASIGSINAAIVALQKHVIRRRVAAGDIAKRTELNRSSPIPVDDALQLRQAEETFTTAQAELNAAREVAERVRATAQKARVDANVAIEKPGVSLPENQSRMAAMNIAGNAEQSEAVAEHRVDIAAAAVGTAKAEIAYLRSRAAGGISPTRALATSAGKTP